MGFVLLNNEGSVAKILHFVSLPPNYVIPKGMILSLKLSTLADERFVIKLPLEANFYYGEAWGQVSHKRPPFADHFMRGSSPIEIIVQGNNALDVMIVRDHILDLIHKRKGWGASNKLQKLTP